MNLISKIDNYLLEEGRKERTSHYPSDINSCMRQLWYKWNNEPVSNPIEAGGYWKMKMGNAIHDLINEFLESAGFDIMNEISNKTKIGGLEHPISYRIDNIFMEDDQMAIIEVKSSYGAGIKAIQKQGKPRDSDLAQVLLYMFLEDINKTYLIYIGRDNGYRTQFEIEYKSGVIHIDGKKTLHSFVELIDRLKIVEEHLIADSIPEREYQVAIKNGEIKDKFQKDKIVYKTDWQCSYCQWMDLCWKPALIRYKNSDNSEIYKKGESNE